MGLREGGSENATVATSLLEELVERGLRADWRRLFVIDGAKALRSAFGHLRAHQCGCASWWPASSPCLAGSRTDSREHRGSSSLAGRRGVSGQA